MLELLAEKIVSTQARIPAWKRSIPEVKIDWSLQKRTKKMRALVCFFSQC